MRTQSIIKSRPPFRIVELGKFTYRTLCTFCIQKYQYARRYSNWQGTFCAPRISGGDVRLKGDLVCKDSDSTGARWQAEAMSENQEGARARARSSVRPEILSYHSENTARGNNKNSLLLDLTYSKSRLPYFALFRLGCFCCPRRSGGSLHSFCLRKTKILFKIQFTE